MLFVFVLMKMRKVYINDWIYGPRRSDFQHTMFRPHMTGSGPTPQQGYVDALVDQVVANGLPEANPNNDTQLRYNNMPVYAMPSGAEVIDLPFFDFDPNNGLMWVGQDILHVTKTGAREDNDKYKRAAMMIIRTMDTKSSKFLGSFTEKQFWKKGRIYSKTLNMNLKAPRDNKIFHTLDGNAITPKQMTELPNMFWVKAAGKNDHYPVLIVDDELASNTDEYEKFLERKNIHNAKVWSYSEAEEYYASHKEEEASTWSKIKSLDTKP